MKAEDILRISDPARLFGAEPGIIRKTYRELIGRWHPDINPDPLAAQVFIHITQLHDRPRRDTAPSLAAVIFDLADGKQLRFRPLRRRQIDAGESLLGAHSLVTIWDRAFANLAQAEIAAITGFRFADSKMQAQMASALPDKLSLAKCSNGNMITVIQRRRSELPLADLLDLRGPLDPRHVGWIGSGLFNVICWLGWSGHCHGAISPEHILIDPDSHNVRLAGGWAFLTRFGTAPTLLPERTLDLIPRLAIPGEVVDARVDLELARQTLRDCLKPALTDLPAPISSFLNLPAQDDGPAEYRDWHRAMERAWGPRKFHPFGASAAEILG